MNLPKFVSLLMTPIGKEKGMELALVDIRTAEKLDCMQFLAVCDRETLQTAIDLYRQELEDCGVG
jgi:hypothetical protein